MMTPQIGQITSRWLTIKNTSLSYADVMGSSPKSVTVAGGLHSSDGYWGYRFGTSGSQRRDG